jgi:RNA polymerase sigma-70 factor (ECF subfamily)
MGLADRVLRGRRNLQLRYLRGVLSVNENPTVQASNPGVAAPPDFTTFMRNYQDMVYSTAVRLIGNQTQAEDIAQDVFIKAYEHFDNLRASPTAGGWLKTVATNLSINHIQRYKKRWTFFSDIVHKDAEGGEKEVEFAAPDTFFAGVDSSERREWVERALEKLPEHQRVPLVLFHFEDMPYEEIAKKTRVSLSKVKTDILRGREALAKILMRSGASHEKLGN